MFIECEYKIFVNVNHITHIYPQKGKIIIWDIHENEYALEGYDFKDLDEAERKIGKIVQKINESIK